MNIGGSNKFEMVDDTRLAITRGVETKCTAGADSKTWDELRAVLNDIGDVYPLNIDPDLLPSVQLAFNRFVAACAGRLLIDEGGRSGTQLFLDICGQEAGNGHIYSRVLTPAGRVLVDRVFEKQWGRKPTVEAPAEAERKPTKKEKRLQYMKTPTFHRKGFKEVRENVEANMEQQFKSTLVDELKTNNFVINKDGVKVHLAKDFGFCWGVERSIALAYEAVEHFPGKTVHITNELIHNPEVNDKLHDMNVQFIEKLGENEKDFSKVEVIPYILQYGIDLF